MHDPHSSLLVADVRHEEAIDSQLERAAESLEHGDTERAMALAEAVLTIDPENADAQAIVTFARFRARKTPRTDSTAARRRLTVLFCDVVGSTELAGRLDPEDTREVLRRYQTACAGVIESFGGTVAHFIGDGILAYFGFPLAHEDDATRAVLAGQAMVAAVDGLPQPGTSSTSVPLAIRVGIHTGLVVVADMGAGRKVELHDIVGETPNLAARIQSEAVAGQVLISDATYELAKPFIEVGFHGSPILRGVSRPVPLYEVLGERSVPWRFEATAGPGNPIVGRDHERAALSDAWRRSQDQAATVFVHGDAGVGKSRLVREITDVAAADGGQVLIVQCNPLRSNEALWPVIRALRGATSLPNQPSADEVATASGLDDPVDIDALTSMFSDHADYEMSISQASPAQRREQRFDALVRWADHFANLRSTLLIIEDLHWADPTTIELVRRIVDRASPAPLMMVVTSRTGLPFEAAAIEELTVGPLSPTECSRLIDQLVPDETARARVREAVVERSDGVPLYVRELTKVMLENGSAALALIDDDQVPIALHDLLVARIDQFAAQREVAQALATFGQATTIEQLTAVLDQSDDRVQRDLDTLVAGGLVRRVGDRFEFVHVLLREAAQRLLLRRHRRALHARIAASLDATAGVDGAGDVTAYHYEQATLYDQAARQYLQSALKQAAAASHEEAIANFTRALRMVSQATEPVKDGVEIEAASGRAASLLAARGYPAPEVAEAFEQVRRMARTGSGGVHLAALLGLWAYHHVRGDNFTSAPLASAAMELARAEGRAGDVEAAAAVLGYQRLWCGDPQGGRADLVLALTRPASLGTDPLPHDPAAGASVNLALGLCLLGELRASREMVAAAVERAAALDGTGAAFTSAYVYAFAAEVFNLMGDHPAAIDIAQQAIGISSQYGFASWLGVGWVQLSIALLSLDPSPEHLAQMRVARQMWDESGALSGMSDLLRALSSGLLRAGERDEAMQVVDEGLRHVEVGNERFLEAELLRIRGVLLADTPGQRAAGVAELQRAVAVARDQGARLHEVAALQSLLDAASPADGGEWSPVKARLVELRAFIIAQSDPAPERPTGHQHAPVEGLPS